MIPHAGESDVAQPEVTVDAGPMIVAVPAAVSKSTVVAKPTVKAVSKGVARVGESHTMLHAMQSLLYIIIVAIFIITFAVQPFRIPSESMEPTLLVGDFLLVAKQEFPFPKDALPSPRHRSSVAM